MKCFKSSKYLTFISILSNGYLNCPELIDTTNISVFQSCNQTIKLILYHNKVCYTLKIPFQSQNVKL